MDLGANGLQTFRYILLPELRSALVAGALLAFALSWDEVIVTIFTAGGNTTIPIWIWTGLRTGGSGSEINVVAAVVVLLEHRAGVLRPAADERSRTARSARRLAVVLMAARAARVGACAAVAWRASRRPAARAARPRTRPQAGPSGPEAAAAARRGRAAPAGAPGLRREQLGEAVRAQHGLPRRGALRGHRRGPAPRRRRLELRRRVDPRRPRLRASPRTAPRARSTPRSCPSARASARRSAIRPPGARARAATASPSCGRRACCSGARPSASTRRRPGRRSRGRTRRGADASRSRTRRSRSAMPPSSCARSSPGSRSATPTRSTRTSSPPRSRSRSAAWQLAGALWQLPGDEIDAFDGGLVDVGAGDWYTAQQIREQNVDVGPDAPARGRAGRGRPLDARRPRARIPAARTAGSATPRRPACRPRWRATSARPRSTATPAACSGRTACRAVHLDAPRAFLRAHRVPPHARRELRRRPPLRPVRALGAGLERPAQ